MKSPFVADICLDQTSEKFLNKFLEKLLYSF
jgi:hypothetical protein